MVFSCHLRIKCPCPRGLGGNVTAAGGGMSEGDISDIKFAQRFKAGPRSIWLNETSKAHPFELKTAAGDESQAKLCPDPDLPEAPPSL